MAGKHKTAIVVLGGLVLDVYSTLLTDKHDIELLDLDNANAEPETSKEKMDARINEIVKSKEYHHVF